MGTLKILAGGKSPQAQAQARGKLFEELMSKVLRHCGYSIDRIPNVNYSEMEIDREGKAIATGISLYAECKCYVTLKLILQNYKHSMVNIWQCG